MGLNPMYATEGVLKFLGDKMGQGEINDIKVHCPNISQAYFLFA
jgi:hypothetical protein